MKVFVNKSINKTNKKPTNKQNNHKGYNPTVHSLVDYSTVNMES